MAGVPGAGRVHPVPPFGGDRVVTQLLPAGHRPDLRRGAVAVGERACGLLSGAHQGTRREQPHPHGQAVRCGRQPVEPGDDRLVDAETSDAGVGRFRGLHVVLVVDGEVVEALLALAVHPVDAVADDRPGLVGERRVVSPAGWDRQRRKVRGAVGVLNAFTGEGGTTCGGADEEPAAAGSSSAPPQVVPPSPVKAFSTPTAPRTLRRCRSQPAGLTTRRSPTRPGRSSATASTGCTARARSASTTSPSTTRTTCNPRNRPTPASLVSASTRRSSPGSTG